MNVKHMISIEGKSQYSLDIDPLLQPSACGPVTAHVMIEHLGHQAPDVNTLYKALKGTRLGLFTHRFTHFMKSVLGPEYVIKRCHLADALKEIRQGRLVAVKFDKYLSGKRKGSFTFSYHWVPLVGYVVEKGELFLYVHDNGGRNRPSRVRKVPYGKNHEILTFVRITPLSELS